MPASKYSVYTAFPLGSFGTYARYREFTLFAANLYFYYAVRYGKPRIGQSLMDALHDFSSIYPCDRSFLR